MCSGKVPDVHLKVTGTSSWIKLVCQKLACITCPKKSYWIFTTTSHYRGHSAVVQHNINFTYIVKWLLGGVRVQTSTSIRSCFCTRNAVYQRFIYLYDITAGPHKVSLKEKFPVCCTLFLKSLGTCFFEYPVAFQPLPLCSNLRYEQKRFVWPCSELLWLCLSHK